uniref:hypothetical protein n=1 Tax=Serratia entomophila TaxID=42906 RepID=UPI001F4BCFBA|nr:hypothetical protein [Serratia entomophila]
MYFFGAFNFPFAINISLSEYQQQFGQAHSFEWTCTNLFCVSIPALPVLPVRAQSLAGGANLL